MTATSIDAVSARAAAIAPSATLALTARVRALRDEGQDVIGFGAGEPDFTTPEPVCSAAIEALQGGMTHYVPVPGAPETRAAVADLMRTRNGIACTGDDVIISNGGKFSCFLAIQALIDPGDEVVLPTPAWLSYKPMVELAGGTLVEVETGPESDFLATPEAIAAAMTPRTKLVIINSPSNPCGTMYAPEQVRALADVVAAHDRAWIMSDEIYDRLVYGGREHLSLGSLEQVADRTITINGLSKTWAATGWRVGWACAPGQGGAVVKAMTRLQSQSSSSITGFLNPAIVAACTRTDEEVEAMRCAFEQRGRLMFEKVSAWPHVTCPPPGGAFYVFPDISSTFGRTSPGGRKLASAATFAEALLEEASVAVVPGESFLGCGGNHVRLSFATDEASITEGCRRVHDWLEALQG
ncbi:MAG: pyridoxal phosphate-dependent aminotransferase [Phycisphaerales bacterium]|nr:pyridoxal phosphate-dependent aminotransferase [Phycisphaerales bacterium]